MKYNKIFFLIATTILVTFSQAEGLSKMTKMQRFYYELGEKASKSKYIKMGYSLATKDFQSMLSKYRKKVAAYEAGKYLIEEGKITYPKVYKIRENGTYRIKISAPIVENEFTAEDLFIIPLLERSKSGNYASLKPGVVGVSRKKERFASAVQVVSPGEGEVTDVPTVRNTTKKRRRNPNAFDLPDLNSLGNKKRPSAPSVVQTKNTILIPYKSASVENFLSIFGSKYREVSGGYKVSFSNQREKEKFCKELSGDKTCRNLHK